MALNVNLTTQVKPAAYAPIIDLQRLGTKKNVDKGQILFVPLCDVRDPDSYMVGSFALTNAMFKFANYTWWTGTDDNKVQKHFVRWVETGLRTADGDALNDPAVELGLTLPTSERTGAPGFDGAETSTFADSDAIRTNVHLPILLISDMDLNSNGCVKPGAGSFAFLELKSNQFNDLVKIFSGVNDANPDEAISYRDGKERKFYDWNGIGRIVKLDKDKARGMKTYEWTLQEGSMLDTDIEKWLVVAVKELDEYVAYVRKTYAYWQPLAVKIGNGEISPEDGARKIFALIAHKLLQGWGVPFEDTVDGIIETFNEVKTRYSVAKGAALGQMGTGRKSIVLDVQALDKDDMPF